MKFVEFIFGGKLEISIVINIYRILSRDTSRGVVFSWSRVWGGFGEDV